MITDVEKTRLKKLFSDTISLLCRSGLPGSCAHRVDALIGVTLDNQEVVLVNISEHFRQENESAARKEIADEKSSDTQCVQAPEKAVASVSYGVKDEYTAGINRNVYTVSALGLDGEYGTDVTAPNAHDNCHSCVEHVESLNMQSTYQEGSGFNRTLPDSEQTLAVESDGDCLLIKTELREDDATLNNILAESESFTSQSTNEVALPSMSAVRRLSHDGLSFRIKHIQSMQRHARHNPFGSMFYRPRQHRHNTMEHNSASNQSQVSTFGNNMSPVLPLDSGADSLMPCILPGDGDKGAMASRETIQCHMCGSWLRGQQTLNEHIRGVHLSIYNYHCKYCGLSFKWRSALRNHQLNCSQGQSVVQRQMESR